MADLTQLNYVPDEIKADAGFEAIPAGDYAAVATASEVKDTKAGDGKFLNVSFEIIEGNEKGRKFFNNYNLVNKSQKAQEIGRSQLKQFGEACGKPAATNSEDLHDTPVVITLAVDGIYNQVKSHKPYQAGASLGQPAQAQAAGSTPSWAAKA